VDGIVPGFDVIVDGADNFPTRYLINDACVKHGKPNVHGSVFRFEGQASVFLRGKSPCYRCLYPEPPPPGMTQSCADAGVLGVLPGVIGLLQAIEAIKLVLGQGDPLFGRLIVYDALGATFRELRIRANPECTYCAPGRAFPGYIDYVGFCGGIGS
jgi:molybdopterin/thiamine biosynthesis adenylyltransferase